MKVVTIVGIRNSGKTTVAEVLISGLRRRGLRVGSVKSIGCGNNCHLRKNGVCGCSGGGAHGGSFSIDKPGSNSHRHRAAGSQLVSTLAEEETAVMFQEALPLDKLLSLYAGYDYVILEGDYGAQVPRIVTAWETTDAAERVTPLTFLVSGRLAATEGALGELPIIDPLLQPERLVDYVLEKLYDHLPLVDPACCSLCGGSCAQLGAAILRGTANRSDCKLAEHRITLTVDGQSIPMTDFVQRVLYNSVLAVTSELKGYREGADIAVAIKGGG